MTNTECNQIIVYRIRQLAKLHNTSITKIEKKLGYANGSIGKWVNATKLAPYERVSAIATELGVDISVIWVTPNDNVEDPFERIMALLAVPNEDEIELERQRKKEELIKAQEQEAQDKLTLENTNRHLDVIAAEWHKYSPRFFNKNIDEELQRFASEEYPTPILDVPVDENNKKSPTDKGEADREVLIEFVKSCNDESVLWALIDVANARLRELRN